MALPAGLAAFLTEQPDMRLAPGVGDAVRLRGTYALDATHPAAGRITRRYAIEIEVPTTFPEQPPIVKEVGRQIPHSPDYHVNPGGSLCMGSPLALQRALRQWPDLQSFLSRTLRPYLYAVTLKLDTGRDFVFGELRHGTLGQLQDLADDLQLTEAQVIAALDLLLLPRADADAHLCACACGRVLGACELRERLDEIRDLASEASWRKLRNEFEALKDVGT